MLALNIVSLLLVIFNFRCNQQQLPQLRVKKRSILPHTDMILVLDFTNGIYQSDVQSIVQLTNKLFKGFNSYGATLRMSPLAMNDMLRIITASITNWHWKSNADSVKISLNQLFNERHIWNVQLGPLYNGALNASARIFRQGNSGGTKKVLVLITQSHESCTIDKCLDIYGCCDNCRGCKDEPCGYKIRRRDNDQHVSINQFAGFQPEVLKKLGVTIITIGIGNKVNATRLRCWSSGHSMLIQHGNYWQLQQKGAAEILDLLSGGRTHTNAPQIRSSTRAILPPLTKYTAGTHTKIPRVRSSTRATLQPVTKSTGGTHINIPQVRSSTNPLFMTASKAAVTISSSKANFKVPLTIPGSYANDNSTQSLSYLAITKNSSIKLRWYWWFLVAIAITAVVLLVTLLLLGVMWRRKRKRQKLVPVVQAENVATFTGYKQPGQPRTNCKPNSTSVSGGSSYLLKKPYLEPDLYTATNIEESRRSGYGLMRTKQQLLTRPIKSAFRANVQEYDAAQRPGTAQAIGPARTTFPPTKFKNPTVYHGKRATKVQIPKGMGFAGVKEHGRFSHGRNVAKQSTRRYDIVSHEPTDRVPPISYVRSTKAFTTPGGQMGGKWVRFRTLA